ncbi:hypothetical protein D9V29_03300 [Mycetocola manganoxydans]|uniref:Asparagine synthase n=1 Tax=Mycetocola manganoxydans TaxID=699879 RepID=A0A3L6ZYD7_9MICO|nr:hypothetical protein [Mycetocola manganoxydans]RLP73043.1 hypothetical protein D9V29_03300 [Mycetocola manganoxydans]
MNWLSRVFGHTQAPDPYRPDPQPLAPFEQALEEGLLIARHGVFLAVRNRLIVRALREGKAFDEEQAARVVSEELTLAAEEQREYAEGARRLLEVAGRSGGIADHAHDYHRIDTLTLSRRQRLYSALADALEAYREDPDDVANFVDRARTEAWNDIGDNVVSQLDQRMSSFADEPEYEMRRPERLRQLLEVDLPALLPRNTDGDQSRG